MGPSALCLSESPACSVGHSTSFLGAGDIPARGYMHLGREHPCVAPLPQPTRPSHSTCWCLACTPRGLPRPPPHFLWASARCSLTGGALATQASSPAGPSPLFLGFTCLCTSHHHWHYTFFLLIVHFLGRERQEGQDSLCLGHSCIFQQLERCSAHSRCSVNTCRVSGWSVFSWWCFHLLMEYSGFSVMSVGATHNSQERAFPFQP